MTLFTELYEMALGTTLVMTISADDRQHQLTINVIPKPRGAAGDPALSTPLTLTATPDEFDAGFVAALSGYRSAHASLAQQVAQTQELLEAAKAASAKKGTTAVARASAKPSPSDMHRTPARTPADADAEDQDDDEGAQSQGAGRQPAGAAATPPHLPVAPLATGGTPQLFG